MKMFFVKPGPKLGNQAEMGAEILDLCQAYGADSVLVRLEWARGHVLIEHVSSELNATHLRTGLESQGYQVLMIEDSERREHVVEYIKPPIQNTLKSYNLCLALIHNKRNSAAE